MTATIDPSKQSKRSTTIRDERLQQLMESCQQEVLRQIIGPFGLTPLNIKDLSDIQNPFIFDDKKGGNVTTQHNANLGIFAKKSERYKRADYRYKAAKSKKKLEGVQNGSMNSQEFLDAYTGKTEKTKRINNKGKLVSNAELDHLVPLKDIHGQGGWMKNKDGRTELCSIKENLHYTTHNTNRSKGAKVPEKALSEDDGFDKARIDPLIEKAKNAVENGLPSNSERLKYHGKKLAKEGAKDAGKNALHQAFRVLFHEFVIAIFTEFKERKSERNMIDQIIESLKRVMKRVIKKLKVAWDAAIDGGISGLMSTLLTFVINNLITTSKKIVTIIRESVSSLWKAIRLMWNPPEGMSGFEITREVTKIIAAVVTIGIGATMEESVKGFIMTIPILIPIAEILATALTAIMTGIAGALIIYSIDRIFDWLSSSDTELLLAQEENAEAQILVVERLGNVLNLQYESSRLYKIYAADYLKIQESYAIVSFQVETASFDAAESIQTRSLTHEALKDTHTHLETTSLDVAESIQHGNEMIETMETGLDRRKRLANALKSI